MPDMNPQYELPPEVAVEIAGYIRSGLFAPLVRLFPRILFFYFYLRLGGRWGLIGVVVVVAGDECWQIDE